MSRDMTYRHLGRSGLLVSPIGLGTMGFGYLTDEPTSVAILDAALDAGINLVDTADVYGGPQTPDMAQGYGLSEEIIGRWLRRTGRRDDIVLATKVYQPMGLGPNDRRLSAYHLRRACEASLRRLQTDHIDLYQMHHVDRATPWEEIWQAMEQLVQQGKISYVGSSNFAGWDIATAQAVASARHFVGLTSEQSLYNLAVRAIEQEVIPALRHLGIGLIAYSPLHAGLLTGVLTNADTAPAEDPRIAGLRDQLNSYEALCAAARRHTDPGGSGLGAQQPGHLRRHRRSGKHRPARRRPRRPHHPPRTSNDASARRDLPRTRGSSTVLRLVTAVATS